MRCKQVRAVSSTRKIYVSRNACVCTSCIFEAYEVANAPSVDHIASPNLVLPSTKAGHQVCTVLGTVLSTPRLVRVCVRLPARLLIIFFARATSRSLLLPSSEPPGPSAPSTPFLLLSRSLLALSSFGTEGIDARCPFGSLPDTCCDIRHRLRINDALLDGRFRRRREKEGRRRDRIGPSYVGVEHPSQEEEEEEEGSQSGPKPSRNQGGRRRRRKQSYRRSGASVSGGETKDEGGEHVANS